MTITIFENARIFDGDSAECVEGGSVVVEGAKIREVSAKPIQSRSARRIDASRHTLMPGLIDLHIHAYASSANLTHVLELGPPYNTAHAVRMLGHALDSGFTTVRDVAGGDWSLAQALAEGLIRGPRFFYAGRAISMTGGHGDFRPVHAHNHGNLCQCGDAHVFSVLADGVDQCLKAAREELRLGAHCIKIMGSGGVASPSDPIWMNQYREDEIRAIVGECKERRTYVSSHCHGAEAVRRSVDFGVRVIEHGTLIDAATAAHVAKLGAYVVPTMIVIFDLVERGASLGLPAVSQEKVKVAHKAALEGLAHLRAAGVKVGFGTDLLGASYVRQSEEFALRRKVFEPVEILRQATSGAAEILMRQGELGVIAPDAEADIILVDGDPLADVELLAQQGRKVDLVMRGGEIVKDRLN
jgi:imidazolonepropionase-like amidohydrolase